MPVIQTQTTTSGKGGKTKTTKTTRTVGTQSTRRSRKKKSSGGAPAMRSMTGLVATSHWNMVRDPCNATLAESAYPGRAGMVNRFTSIQTYSGVTGQTAFMAQYLPAGLAFTATAPATSATSFVQTFDQGMAGQTYVVGNSESYRVIGFCVNISYIGTELNRSGTIYGGILPASSIPAGAPHTVDAVKALLPNESRTPDRELELLWFPGTMDMDYAKNTDDVFKDPHNILVIAAEGLPDGLSLRIRQTIIVEWLPKVALGMSMPPPVSGSNPPAFYESLHETASRSGLFTSAFEGAAQRGRQYAYYAGQRMVDASVGMAALTLSQGARRRIRN